MENKLINYEYFVGRNYADLCGLAVNILQHMMFDWILRPRTPEVKKGKYGKENPDEVLEHYRFIVRFADSFDGYLLQAEITDPLSMKLIVSPPDGEISTRDALMLLDTPFKLCHDEYGDTEIFGDYKEI